MRTRATLPLGCVVVAVLFLSCGAIAASPQPQTTTYNDIVDMYRQGADELALRLLSGLTQAEITHARDTLFAAFDSKRRDESERAAATIRGAVILHTARAFAALDRNNNGQFESQLKFAEAYVSKLASRDPRAAFVRTWPLFVLALLQEGRLVLAASEFGRRARGPTGDSPELLLALGATEEMAWWIHHQDDVNPGMKGDLKDAERHYRQVLILAPSWSEARLRLGHVLVLRDDPEGMKLLGRIGASAEKPYQYLARLFEGQVLERRGDTAEAEQRYSAAVSLMPTAQSAYMALAHVRHARGARAEAAQDVRSTAGAKEVSDTADPWFWYSRGTAWRARGYFEDLQSMIRQ